MTAAKPRSFGERLQALPLEIKQCEKKIDDWVAGKLEILRRDGAASAAAARARRALRDLKDLHLDLIAEKAELEPLAGREWQQQQQATWPTNLEAAQAELLMAAPEIERRQAVPRVDRSAKFDAELDGMINRQYRLTKLIESFAPRDMTPQGVKWDSGVPLVAR